jgi:tRNA modification GTPase
LNVPGATRETVCAPATPPGRAALAVVRVTGSGVPELIRSRLGRKLTDRRATLVRWTSSEGALLDSVVATWFAGPGTYTGEDVLELSLHGNPLVVRAVLDDLHRSGIPLAAPGEFTRRAVENGRMELSRAESVGALIHAETESSVEAARRILSGGLADRIALLREKLVELSARLELEVDFAEEDAVPGGQELLPWVDGAQDALRKLLAAQDRVEARGHAPRAVLVGSPNAGKSSLANALLGEDRLLVSPVAGTTRDWVEIAVPTPKGTVVVVDTAGLGDPRDALDEMAQVRTREVLAKAALRVLVAESGRPLDRHEKDLTHGSEWLVVRTKSDLHPGWVLEAEELGLSVPTGDGLEAVRNRLASLLLDGTLVEEEIALVGARQRQAALSALAALENVRRAIETGTLEVAAWEARQAWIALEELVGGVSSDQILSAVFSSFCIGK